VLQQPLAGVHSAPASSAGVAPAPVDVAAVAAKVIPAVAYITVENGYTSGGGSATGIVLTADGYVLTNHHVIDGATSISATLVSDGRTYAAQVEGYDSRRDIALIKLQGAGGLPTAAIGDASELAVGDVVVGAGNAGGAGGAPTVVAGVVLGLDRQIVARDGAGGAQLLSGLIHTDADVRSGHSGGPLADADGEVIGVMTAASVASPHGPDASDTDGFAVPIDTAMAVVAQIRAGDDSGTVHVGETAFLGVQTVDVGQVPSGYADHGAVVTAVVPGSPAEGAGLAAGDVVTAVDGAAVTSAEALGALIVEYRPGDTVTVSWIDASGAARSAQVELAAGPAR